MSDSPLSDAEKAIFRAATERRKQRGIKLQRFSVMLDKSQVEGLYILWDAWVDRWGKERAADELIRLMARVEARLMDKERAKQ
jgi:hypothetical protein